MPLPAAPSEWRPFSTRRRISTRGRATFYACVTQPSSGWYLLRQASNAVDDPAVRAAVLDLFRANEAFRAAYRQFEQTGDQAVIDRAADRVDEARERASFAQSRLP